MKLGMHINVDNGWESHLSSTTSTQLRLGMAQRRFECVFDDESERSRINFEFPEEESERFCVAMEGR